MSGTRGTDTGADFTVPPDETPGEHADATGNGVRLHYVVAGPEDGPLVVLLHGFPEFWYGWRRQLSTLADAGYRVVAPDLRGYNCSDAPRGVSAYRMDLLVADIEALIGHFGCESASVVGHDWGGGIAWQLGIDQPDLVDRLAVLNAPHPAAFERAMTSSLEQLRKSWYFGLFQLPWLPERLLASRRLGTLERVFESANAPAAFTETDLERYRTAFERSGRARAAIDYYRAAVREQVGDTIRGDAQTDEDVLVPTLVLWGEDDQALSTRLLDDLDLWVSDLRIERLSDTSHWVHHDEPERVSDELQSFLSYTDRQKS